MYIHVPIRELVLGVWLMEGVRPGLSAMIRYTAQFFVCIEGRIVHSSSRTVRVVAYSVPPQDRAGTSWSFAPGGTGMRSNLIDTRDLRRTFREGVDRYDSFSNAI